MIFRRRRPDDTRSPARAVPTGAGRKKQLEAAIPLPVEIAGQWAWRILAVLGVLVVIGSAVHGTA